MIADQIPVNLSWPILLCMTRAVWYNTWRLISLTPFGIVFSFLSLYDLPQSGAVHICCCTRAQQTRRQTLPTHYEQQIAGLLDEVHVHACRCCMRPRPYTHTHTHTMLANKGPAWLLDELHVMLAAAARGHSQVQWL